MFRVCASAHPVSSSMHPHHIACIPIRPSVRFKLLLPLVFSLINVFLVLVPVPVPVNLVVPVRVLLDVLLL